MIDEVIDTVSFIRHRYKLRHLYEPLGGTESLPECLWWRASGMPKGRKFPTERAATLKPLKRWRGPVESFYQEKWT